MKLETFELPECVVCYAMYGEPSGDDELDSAYDEWFKDTMKHFGYSAMFLVDVTDDKGFMAWHELKNYGIGSCDVQGFTFDCVK